MKIAIIGGGAAGLFCAANIEGQQVVVFEKNQSCGKKLLLTGGGRCNYTNKNPDFLACVPQGAKFLRSAISAFGPKELVEWFEQRGLKTIFEGDRGFPATQKASDVLNLFVSECKKKGVEFCFGKSVEKVTKKSNGKFEILDEEFDAVVIATGGKTFAQTGSTGDGNNIFSANGIVTKEFSPKLGPIIASRTKDLQGVSAHVGLTLCADEKKTNKIVGDVVFTHFGISGPAALDASAFEIEASSVLVDFLPLQHEALLVDKLKNIRQTKTTYIKNELAAFVPRRVAEFISFEIGIEKSRACDLSNKDIANIVESIKKHCFKVQGFGSFDNSWVSAGGVDLAELNPKTCECKRLPNAFAIGEAIDAFGLCGGYNLQIAFSTAVAAARKLSLSL